VVNPEIGRINYAQKSGCLWGLPHHTYSWPGRTAAIGGRGATAQPHAPHAGLSQFVDWGHHGSSKKKESQSSKLELLFLCFKHMTSPCLFDLLREASDARMIRMRMNASEIDLQRVASDGFMFHVFEDGTLTILPSDDDRRLS
jgi:hypothetical protein